MQADAAIREGNTLFPVFLKLDQLFTVVVGGGIVGTEKLLALLSNSPDANVKLVAIDISNEIVELAKKHPQVTLQYKPYHTQDLDGADLVIAAVNDATLSKQVVVDARQKKILVNAADQPLLCDFYLSAVVKKGNLKIAISTNGKSPTIAKRIKEMLNDVLPEELDELLHHMQKIRNSISGDFNEKVMRLNNLTRTLSTGDTVEEQ
jgi:uncharacterized protein